MTKTSAPAAPYSATATFFRLARMNAMSVQVIDEHTSIVLGQVDVRLGFAHYFGAVGSVHEGMTAVIRGGIEGFRTALALGIRNGRDDRS